ncbi:MAG: hypothetical protein DMG07_03010 [Acidobacteria bacterium]|nr:MAG: hypothetical protein DMG07_03010 [Acidobacteriota bacterium]
MSPGRLVLRSLRYFWRTNLAVVAGVATAVSVLAGALMVGDSVRASLRDLAMERLGAVDFVVSSDRLFREELAEVLRARPGFAEAFRESCPILFLPGVVIAERSGLRAHDVEVYGVDDRFWSFQGRGQVKGPAARQAFLGRELADELGAAAGDTLLVRVEKQRGIPKESLFGRREDAGRTIRLECGRILAGSELGEFSLRPGQASVRSIYVPLARLQRDLEQPARANAVLVSSGDPGGKRESLRRLVRESVALEDLGVRLRRIDARGALSLESERIVVDDALARAAAEAAAETGLTATRLYTYLANSIRAGERSIPYSVVTAAEPAGPFSFLSGADAGAILLNDWAARDLAASPGDTVTLEYFYWLPEGRLTTRSAEFRVARVVPLAGDADDPTLAPELRGITEAENIGDWDPPFPVDLRRIRPRDEEYWRKHRTTPKAFLRLERGQELWGTRFGRLTSVRLTAPAGADIGERFEAFRERLRARLEPESAGIALVAAREGALAASGGTTDFGEYFLYFSFFLIAAAALLAALFFRLGVEARVREIGILRAAGIAEPKIRNLFLSEGALLAAAGSALGAVGALGFAALLVAGLRTWWVGAVGTRRLSLHPAATPLAAGAVAGVAMALVAAAWTVRSLRRHSARSLLSGNLEPPAQRKSRRRALGLVCGTCAAAAVALVAAGILGKISDAGAFFGAGSMLLASLLAAAGLALRGRERARIGASPLPVALQLGARNTRYRPGRSLLSAALIASATFVIVSMESFRSDPERASLDRRSGAGGYPLFARAVLPLVSDPNSREGLEALNLSAAEIARLAGVRFAPFRVRDGDDTSCLNLFAPQDPRILGARRDFLESGRFSFQAALDGNAEEKTNPWLLLERPDAGGAVPAIGDSNTITYILHRKVGDEITVARAGGETARLRLVAALRDSIFQGELILSETNFLRLFPEREGYRFLLVDAPAERAAEVTRALEEGLADFGLDVGSTRERLAAYHRVENTYLSTFQSLGGLGLVLGTVGMGAVLARNVMERRSELALLRAVGYSRRTLSVMVVAENLLLIALGLGTGVACAAVAILPALRSRGPTASLASLAVTLGLVAVVGSAASILAVVSALGAPLVPALRNE